MERNMNNNNNNTLYKLTRNYIFMIVILSAKRLSDHKFCNRLIY